MSASGGMPHVSLKKIAPVMIPSQHSDLVRYSGGRIVVGKHQTLADNLELKNGRIKAVQRNDVRFLANSVGKLCFKIEDAPRRLPVRVLDKKNRNVPIACIACATCRPGAEQVGKIDAAILFQRLGQKRDFRHHDFSKHPMNLFISASPDFKNLSSSEDVSIW